MSTVFIVLGVFAIVGVLVSLWQSIRFASADTASELSDVTTQERAALLDEKNAVLRAIKDLEFERAVGKLSDEDFARLDAKYRSRAKHLLAALDADLGTWRARAEEVAAAYIEAEEKRESTKGAAT